MILNGFLDDHRFGEVFLEPLIVEGHGCSVQDFLLSIAETVIAWVELPLVVPGLLLSWCVVTVSLFVHLVHLRVLADEGTAHWINHFFGAFKATCGYTEGMGSLGSHRPIVVPGVAFTEWFTLVRSVLVFLDIVEFVCEAVQVLGFDNLANVL